MIRLSMPNVSDLKLSVVAQEWSKETKDKIKRFTVTYFDRKLYASEYSDFTDAIDVE